MPNVSFGAVGASGLDSFVRDASAVDVVGANESAVDEDVSVGAAIDCDAGTACFVCGAAVVVTDDVVVAVGHSTEMVSFFCFFNITSLQPAVLVTSAAGALESDTVTPFAAGFTSLAGTFSGGGVVSPVKKRIKVHERTGHTLTGAFSTSATVFAWSAAADVQMSTI